MDQEGESYHRGLSCLALMCIASGVSGGGGGIPKLRHELALPKPKILSIIQYS